ncbi:hypothetical protein Tco_0456889, partial [Tanacetum coccineum]
SNVALNSEKDESLPKDDAGKKNEVKDSAKEVHLSSSFTTMDLGRAKEQRNEYESLFDPLIPDLEDTC